MKSRQFSLLSVITVVFNGERYIEKTIQSVSRQTYPHIEYIVVDGGSTDRTAEIMQDYREEIDVLIKEPDRGIYDAMNKGISYASGEWINFLNGGDTYVMDTILERIFQSPELDRYDLIYGDSILVNTRGQVIRSLKAERLNMRSIQKGMVVCHQSIFIRRTRCPLYDLKYRYKAEYNWLIDILLQDKLRMRYVKEPVVYYCTGGFSQKGFFANFVEFIGLVMKRFGYRAFMVNFLHYLRIILGFYLRKYLYVETLRFWDFRKQRTG